MNRSYTPAQKEAYYIKRARDPKATDDQKCYALFFIAGMDLYEAVNNGGEPCEAVQEVAKDKSHPQHTAVKRGYANAWLKEMQRLKDIRERDERKDTEEKQRQAERIAEMKSGFYRG